MAFRSALTQWFPPAPSLTEENLPRQTGKIFIVTGGNAGIGFELVKILYAKGGTVYMASRSQKKAEAAIETIKSAVQTSQGNSSNAVGSLKFLHLDLNDLTTIKASAAAFAAQESKLDVLWNNAGIGAVPITTKTKQNLEAHIGVNCVGPFLFTKLLLPQLQAAARASPKDTVRVVWTSSWMAESQGPKGGIDFVELANGGSKDPQRNYAVSKVGNWLLAVDMARRHGEEGIISVVQNPGNLATDIWQHVPKFTMMMLSPLLHQAKLGAYTELWAGLSEDVTAQQNGAYIIPWGRLQQSNPRKDIVTAMKDSKDGGSSVAEKFWNWCEQQTENYS
jgi:NAD(P)-dependent dehydrogenase (short-subunit alcohol dehydrogenase family)